MDEKRNWAAREQLRYLGRGLAASLVFLYLGAMIVLYRLAHTTVFEPPLLLLILNTTFAGLIPIAVSIFAARGYFFSGLNSLLFMGCGMLTFGCGAAMAGWLVDGQQVPNVNVTIMNVGALLGSAFHAVGAILALKKLTSETKPHHRKSRLILAYAGMFLVVLGCTLATRRGLTPVFFIQGGGPTLVRQYVLGTAVGLFLLSALVSLSLFTKGRRPFHYWYALSLIMIALGLTAFFIQRFVGSPIGWLGRSGEYLGGIFALIAILGLVRDSRFQRVPIPSAVTELFQNTDVGYQALLETVADPIVAFERDGKIVLWNPAAETTFGCRNQDALGASLFNLVIGESSLAGFRAHIDGLIAPGNPGPGRPSLEILGKAKDGRAIPLEVSSSARMGAGGQWLFVSVLRDLSDRQAATAKLLALNESLERRVEERTRAVRESEFRWHFAIEGSGDGLWDWNVPAGTVFFSPRWKAMLGFADDEIGDRLEEWSQRVHPDDLPRVMAEVQAYLAGTTPLYASEHRVRCKDGSWKWIIDRGMVVSRDPAGKPLRVVGTHKDITERKEAEATLRASQASYQRLFREMQNGFAHSEIICDAQGRPINSRYLAVNPAFERITGRPAAAVVGKTILEVFPALEPGWLEVFGRVALTGEPASFEMGAAELGAIFDVAAYCPAPNEYACTFSDSTARRAAEKTLRLQGAALDAAANAIVITDRQGLIEWANPAFFALSGWSFAEAVGKNPRDLVKSGEHDAAFYQQMWETILAGKVWRGEIINRRKDGAQRTEDMTITPLHDAQGEITHFVAIKQDITDHKTMETHFMQAQRMEAIGSLAGGIAHDLNNILSPITLVTGLLENMLPSGREREMVAMMQSNAKRGADIIKQLLIFSRGQTGERSALQVRHLINDMVMVMTETFPREIDLQHEVSRDLWPLIADPTQLHLVLMNLCVNARDAMPTGGHLKIKASNANLEEGDLKLPVRCKSGPYVVVEVSDTGHGITPEIKHRIFDPFFTTKPLGKGTGLGLSTVVGIVNSHGGFVDLDSTPQVGSSFKVYLPGIPDGTETMVEIRTAPAFRPSRGQTILVVDDERNIRDALRLVLAEQNFNVLVAVNGNDALEQYLKHRTEISLVLTDLMMPMMGGMDLIRVLRVINPTLKIIAMSGLTEAGEEQNLAALGVPALLEKPCSGPLLLETVHRQLGDHDRVQHS